MPVISLKNIYFSYKGSQNTHILEDLSLDIETGELLAIKEVEPGKDIVVVYRELEHDGFVITAFLTRRRKSFDRRPQLWP